MIIAEVTGKAPNIIEGDKFRLLPVYDMCAMGFSPKSGEVLPFDFTPEIRAACPNEHQTEIEQGMAHEFWDDVLMMNVFQFNLEIT